MKKVKIFAPVHQQHSFLMYCSKVFNFDDVYFSNNFKGKKIFEKVNIIDIFFLKQFSKTTFNLKSKYIIFFWNGEKQYLENYNIIDNLKRRLKKNVTFFFVGKATNIRNVVFAKNRTKNKKFKFHNVKLRHFIYFNFPLLFSFLGIFKNFLFFLKNNNKEKICFTGLVKIDRKFILHLKKDWNFSSSSLKIFKKLKDLNNKKINYDTIISFDKFFKSKLFYYLPISEKYFITQMVLRNLICGLLKKNNNFYLQDWNDRKKIMDSVFFRKFTFLDFGSTAGNEKVYIRYLILKIFNKKYLRINFYLNKSNFDFLRINNKIINYILKLHSKNLDSMNVKQLITSLKEDL